MQQKKGISLIVLVITIIVMIIIAGAIVITLNNSGIIGKASDAVSESDFDNVKTAAQLTYAEMLLSENENPSKILSQGEYIKNKLIQKGVLTEEQSKKYRFKNNGEVVKLQTKAEYEKMYANELAEMDMSCYTLSDDGVFSLKDNLSTAERRACTDNVIVLAIPYGTTTVDLTMDQQYLREIIMPDTVMEWKNGYTAYSKITDIVFSKNIRSIDANLYGTDWYKARINNEYIVEEGILIAANNEDEENIIIPNGVEVITSDVFATHYKIKTIIVPNTVDTIKEVAFQTLCGVGEINTLTKIDFLGAMPEIGDSAFGGRPYLQLNEIYEKNPNALLDDCNDRD